MQAKENQDLAEADGKKNEAKIEAQQAEINELKQKLKAADAAAAAAAPATANPEPAFAGSWGAAIEDVEGE